MLSRVIERAAPQVGQLVLSANGDPGRFDAFGLPVVADPVGDRVGDSGGLGPLAGVLAGLDWVAEQAAGVAWVASFATDTPFFPGDLVARLAAETDRGAQLACACCAGRMQPLFGLWPMALREDLRRALGEEGVRKVDGWTARYRLAQVAFSSEPFDPFFNINTPADLATAENLLPDSG